MVFLCTHCCCRRRMGRWLTDVSHYRPLLSGRHCAFTVQSTPWSGRWLATLQLRLSPLPPAAATATAAEEAGPGSVGAAGAAPTQVCCCCCVLLLSLPSCSPLVILLAGVAALAAGKPFPLPLLLPL